MRLSWLLCVAFSLSLLIPFNFCSACTCSIKIANGSTIPTSSVNAVSADPGEEVSITANFTYSSCSNGVPVMQLVPSVPPPGMQFVVNAEHTSGVVSGNPTTSGVYFLFFEGDVYQVIDDGDVDLLCTQQVQFTLTINSPPAPKSFTVTQQSTDEVTRVKKQNCNFNNILKWKAPKNRASIVAYRIYLDRDLQHLVGEIPSLGRKQIRVVHRDVNPCIIDKYFIVSVDEFGNLSRVVKGRVRGAKRHCLIDR